jgi:predicted nucleotidyltransferase
LPEPRNQAETGPEAAPGEAAAGEAAPGGVAPGEAALRGAAPGEAGPDVTVLGEAVLGEAVLADAVMAYRAVFGSRLVAAYVLGSLAHGGFSALVSDVDLGLVLADPLRMTDRLAVRRVARTVRVAGPALHEQLSVFWGTPSTLRGQRRGGRFPPLDRLDLLAHGRLLTGADARQGLPRPGQAELLTAGAGFALGYLGVPAGRPDGAAFLTWPGRAVRRLARPGRPGRPGRSGGRLLDQLRAPSELADRGLRPLTKAVLFPVRFLYTAATGQVGINDAAVAWYLAGPPAPGAALVRAAAGWRREPPSPAAAATLLDRELIPLYLEYFDDHIARLAAAGQPRLAGRFRWCRARLLA